MRVANVPAAVLFDRDGTLVEDVPYNGDPALVRPMPGAKEALAVLRTAGVRTGVVSNQSGIARGLLTPRQVEAVNARVVELLGPFDVWKTCPHGEGDGCRCRKPRPGLIFEAAKALGVPSSRCVVIGDIASDVEAAHAAKARAVLVPTPRTRPEEVEVGPRQGVGTSRRWGVGLRQGVGTSRARATPCVAPDLRQAVALVLRGGVS